MAVGVQAEMAQGYISEGQFRSCTVACLNGPDATIVSDMVDEMETLRLHFERKGVKCSLLPVPFAFHSSQIDVMQEDFQDIAQQVHYEKPTAPVVSTPTGRVISC